MRSSRTSTDNGRWIERGSTTLPNIDADAAGFDADADAVAGLDIDDLLEAEAVGPDIEEDLTDYFDIRVKNYS